MKPKVYKLKKGQLHMVKNAKMFKEPKKKKLVYQWLYEQTNGLFDLTGLQFGINEREQVREYIKDMMYKESGILRPFMESEKEIDV